MPPPGSLFPLMARYTIISGAPYNLASDKWSSKNGGGRDAKRNFALFPEFFTNE